jgi:hypothetical protein
MIQLIGNPKFWALVGAYWVFSAAVGALQKPDDKSGGFYKWVFSFLNTLAGNLSRAFSSKIPGVVPMVALCVGLLAFSGCAAKAAVHPGALNAADSQAYDTLIIAQAALNESKAQFAAIPEAKQPLNDAIAAYDTAEASYKVYHSTGSGDISSLNAQLGELVKAIAAIQKQFGGK